MKVKIVYLIIILSISNLTLAQEGLDYYLPQNVAYDEAIPTPKEVLGYEVGEWHVSHDQLLRYMEKIAEASDRVQITEHGYTHENRPLLLLNISSPENLTNLENIQRDHVQLTDPSASADLNIANMPVVVWMGYSVHGNEPSGSNAALLVAYYLAAAQGDEIDALLNESIILLDPSINPDGLNRFASWVNTHKSKNVLVTDPNSREFGEAWPRGRTNHYWFDLNRDWLPLQHPESRGRLKRFHEWKPNVLTDHHEMGTNASFFFQPGIPSRNHPLTPENNFILTEKIAEYHAEALDEIGSFYYTKESFDDFFYGKGSTYPDINGAVGILFEQASSRGHAQESDNGIIRFPFTIKNHFTTSLSTLKASQALREDLLNHQRTFYSDALEEGGSATNSAYIFGDEYDPMRAYHFAEIVKQHDIDIYQLNEDITINDKNFRSGNAYIIPRNQPQYRLIEAMFEVRTEFQDSLFYDISAWTLPYAFNLQYEPIVRRSFNNSWLGDKVEEESMDGNLAGESSEYAYLMPWEPYYSPKALNAIFEAGLRAKVATDEFTLNGKKYHYGTILVSVQNQDKNSEEIKNILSDIVQNTPVTIDAVGTGLSQEGINLGSPAFQSIEKPKVAILAEGGVSSYDAGEVWHLMDQRYHMPLTMLPTGSVSNTDLSRYNVIVMVDGNYNELDAQAQQKLKQWVEQGGSIVAMKRAAKWLSDKGLSNVKYKKNEQDSTKQHSYVTLSDRRGAQVIGGAIFNAKLDITHPLGYGYRDDDLTVFRNNALFMEPSKNPYGSPLRYSDAPLASGYISAPNLDSLANSAAITVSALGRGKIVSMTDNPNFRAFWYGTNKLFANALFFSQIISANAAR